MLDTVTYRNMCSGSVCHQDSAGVSCNRGRRTSLGSANTAYDVQSRMFWYMMLVNKQREPPAAAM